VHRATAEEQLVVGHRKEDARVVNSEAFSVPNVDSITVTATKITPPGPINRCATSAATSREVRISSIGITPGRPRSPAGRWQ